eukprot:29907_1
MTQDNANKRSLTPILSESSDEDMPPRKRRKLGSSYIPSKFSKSKLFSNYLDQCQYHNIFICLHKELNLELVISKIIAEFSVGEIKHCENYKNCKNDIHTLEEHHSVYGTMNNSLLDYDRYIDNKTGQEILFCESCSLKLMNCSVKMFNKDCSFPFVKNEQTLSCDCGSVIHAACYKHSSFCKLCNVVICSQDQCTYHASNKYCIECNVGVCSDNKNRKHCAGCSAYVCSKCIKLFNCSNDENLCHWNHGICAGNLSVCTECDGFFCDVNSDRDNVWCTKCGRNICDNCIKMLECGHSQHWFHGECKGSKINCM